MALDTSVLSELFEDDWNNAFKPLHVTDTFYSCCAENENSNCGNGNNSAILDDVLTRQDIIEDKINSLEIAGDLDKIASLLGDFKEVSANVDKLSNQYNQLSEKIESVETDVNQKLSDLESVKNHQGEIDNFLNSIFQWEDKNGNKLN